jgi:hypothetical protein
MTESGPFERLGAFLDTHAEQVLEQLQRAFQSQQHRATTNAALRAWFDAAPEEVAASVLPALPAVPESAPEATCVWEEHWPGSGGPRRCSEPTAPRAAMVRGARPAVCAGQRSARQNSIRQAGASLTAPEAQC